MALQVKDDEAGGDECQNYRATVAEAGGGTFQSRHRIHSTMVMVMVLVMVLVLVLVMDVDRLDLLLWGVSDRLDSCCGGSGCCCCCCSGSEQKTAYQPSPHQLLRFLYLADLPFVVLRDFTVFEKGLQLEVATIST